MMIIDVWKCSKWDGGDRMNFSHYLAQRAFTREQALSTVRDHGEIVPTSLVIFETLEELDQAEHKTARRRAWNKLDPIERRALGLNDEEFK